MAAGDIFVYPNLADGVTVTTGTTAWVWTAYVELVPASTITFPFAVIGMSFIQPLDPALATTESGNTSLATGTGGSEVEFAQFNWALRRETAANHLNVVALEYTLPEPVEVAANTRIAVRVAWSAGAKGWAHYKIRYKDNSVAATAFPFQRRDHPRSYAQLRR